MRAGGASELEQNSIFTGEYCAHSMRFTDSLRTESSQVLLGNVSTNKAATSYREVLIILNPAALGSGTWPLARALLCLCWETQLPVCLEII